MISSKCTEIKKNENSIKCRQGEKIIRREIFKQNRPISAKPDFRKKPMSLPEKIKKDGIVYFFT